MTALLESVATSRNAAAAAAPGLSGAPTTDVQTTKPPRRRVLCVDDESFVTASLRRLLRNEPYEVVTANSGAEALALMEQNPTDLIISDYRMPQMTGVQLLREVRRRWPDTLRVVLSGFTEIDTLIASVNEGEIYKFLNKPWDDTELKLHIRSALEQQALVMENRRLLNELTAENRRLEVLNRQLTQVSEDARSGQHATQIMMEHLGLGVLVVDPDGLIVYANQWSGRLVSWAAPDLIGEPAAVAVPCVIYDAVLAPNASGRHARVELNGHVLQCRCHAIPAEGLPNRLLTIWEELP